MAAWNPFRSRVFAVIWAATVAANIGTWMLNVSAQFSIPNWVRGRGLAIYVTAFFGSMTVGSVVWGQLAGMGPTRGISLRTSLNRADSSRPSGLNRG
jgi:hypothetical protein